MSVHAAISIRKATATDMMRPLLGSLMMTLLTLCVACGASGEEEEGVPSMLRTRFETEMKTILRDLKSAQEMASVSQGRYLELEPLTQDYFNRPVPETYDLELADVSATGFTATLVHRATGITCRLVVSPGSAAAGEGVPRCE